MLTLDFYHTIMTTLSQPIIDSRVYPVCGFIMMCIGCISDVSVYSPSIYSKIYLVLLIAFAWHPLLNCWFNMYTTRVNIVLEEDVDECKSVYYRPVDKCSNWNKRLLMYIYYFGITDKKCLTTDT